ncbi:MAG TPA: response regulator transcription factor [Azospirillum sp.]|nr:response regulator transcription factor [Azospirillum sp.]
MHIALATHHKLLMDGLRPYLSPLCLDGALVETSSLSDLRAAMQGAPGVGLAIVDFCMPGVRFPDVVADLKQHGPDTRIVVLGPALHRSFILDIMRSGASGYLTKQMSANAVKTAVQLVANGDAYVPAAVLSMPADANSQVCGHGPMPDTAAQQLLTAREREILRLMREGMPNKVIANTLQISLVTVKSHLSNVFRKIGARNRVDAVRILGRIPDEAASGYSRACC